MVATAFAEPPTIAERPQTAPRATSEAFSVTLGRAEFDEIRALSRNIRKDANTVIIGIGQSCTPWMTYFSEITPRSAYTIPLSGFRKLEPGKIEGKDLERLYEHFDSVFPTKAALGDKEIVISDFANRGASFSNQRHYIEKWMRARDYKNKVQWVAIVTLDNLALVRRNLEFEPDVRIIGVDGILASRLDRAEYDVYSKVGSADPAHDFTKLDFEGRQHGAFRSKMRAFLVERHEVSPNPPNLFMLPAKGCGFELLKGRL